MAAAPPSPFARTPDPPYVAVIFTSLRTEGDQGYAQMSDEMVALAEKQPGYLGMESARGEDGLGITISYWKDQTSAVAWKAVADHRTAQRLGREKWYSAYKTRVCTVERDYGFNA